MKRKLHFTLLAIAAMLLICSCSSDSDPVPQGPLRPHLYEQDSLALAEIWKAGKGELWDTKWDMNDFTTWGGVSAYLSDPKTNEYRVFQINLSCTTPRQVGILSPEVSKLTELRFLYLDGKGWGGALPESISELKKLEEISILNTTFFGEMPSGLLSLPKLRYFTLDGSKIVGKLPEDITQTAPSLVTVDIRNSSLSGKIPSGITVQMNLDGNEFTEYPFEYLVKGSPFISMRHNKITGLIPDSILNDLYWKDNFQIRVHPQKESYGYSNIPDDWWKPF